MKKNLLTLAILCSLSSFAEEGSFMDPINDAGYGTFSGKIQSLTMSRDRHVESNELRGDTSTLALTLGYVSPEVAGFTIGAEWVSCVTLWDRKEDIPINNEFHILNNAYLNWNMGALGLEKSDIRAGRFTIDSLLMSKSGYRQKKPAMEGVVFETSDIADSKLTLGWMRKYSSWSSLDYETSNSFNYEFTDIYKIAGKDYSTSGTYFIDYTYTGFENLTINVGDFFSENIFNTVFVSADWQITEGLAWRNHWAHQNSVKQGNGSYGGGDLRADYLETSLVFTADEGSYVRPGIWYVPRSGDGTDVHNVQDLFQSKFAPTMAMLGMPWSHFDAGTVGYFVEGVAKLSDKDKIWSMLAYTDVDNTTAGNAYKGSIYDSVEANFVYARKFTKNFSGSVKLAYAILDGKSTANDTEAWDARLFLTYTF